MMKQFTSFLAAGITLAGAVGASADMTLGPITTSTPIPSMVTDWTGALSFARFNPSLGTLESVTLDFSSTLTTTVTVQNNAGSSSSGTARTEVQITVQDTGNNLNAPELDTLSPTYSYTLGPGQNTTSGLLTKSGSSSDTYTLGSILAEFTGTGNITLPASTFTQTLLANTGGNTAASQVTDAGLTGTVTYDYTVVPEPTTMLFGGMLILPFLHSLKRKAAFSK